MEFNFLTTKSLSVFFKVPLLTYQIFPVSAKTKLSCRSVPWLPKLQKCTLVAKIPNLPKKWINIHSSDPSFFKGGGGGNFDYLTLKGESEKLKKRVEVWCRGRSS